MSQTRNGRTVSQSYFAEFDSVPVGPTSAILLQSYVSPNDTVDSRLLEFALRLCSDPEPHEATNDALAALSELLPECISSIVSRSGTSDATGSECTLSTSPNPDCAGESVPGQYVWQLGDHRLPSTLVLRILAATADNATAALAIGARIATLLSAWLRRYQSHLELEARRCKYEELFHRAVQAEKLAGYGCVVAGVLHDLNNPLTAIVAYSDHLIRALPEQNVAPADLLRLARIREAAERAHEHTRGLVEYARPSGSKSASVDLAKIVSNALVFCEHEFALVGIRAETNFSQLDCSVRGIAGQLTQLFVNLFTNAAHAARENDARLTVECEPRGAPQCALVRVIDNGTGILEQDLEHIFDPFFTTKCDGRGNGLGLAIVRDIVDGHGGRIEVSSQAGSGTTFSIWLPLSDFSTD